MEPELHVDDVARAAERLAGIANITPELTSRTLDERFDAHLRLKASASSAPARSSSVAPTTPSPRSP